MRSPIQALLWEQWRQVRLPIAIMTGITLIGSWSLHVALVRAGLPANEVAENWDVPSTFVAAISLMLIGAVLLFAHSSPRDLRMGLPARMMTLPVSRLRLAITQIVFRLVTVALVATVLGLGLTLIQSSYLDSVAPLTGLSILCYTYASAVASTVGKRAPVIALVVTLITISPVLASVNAIQDRIGPALGIESGAFLLFGAVCTLVSLVGIARRDRTVPFLERFRVAQLSPSFARIAPGDREAGQLSYEWQRVGWYPVSFTALLAAGVIFAKSFSNWGAGWSEHYVFGLAYILSIFGLPVATFLTGMLLLAREHRDSIGGLTRLTWSRPMSVQQVVMARMKAVSMSLVFTYGPLLILMLLAAIYTFAHSGAPLRSFLGLEYPLMLWAGLAVLCWSIVWVPYVPVFCLVYFSVIAALTANVPSWRHESGYWFHVVPDMVGLLLLVCLAYACWRRRIFHKRVVVSFVAVCTLIYATGLVEFHRLDTMSQMNMPDLLYYRLTGFVLSFMPLLGLLWQGAFLDRVRHGALFRRLPARNEND